MPDPNWNPLRDVTAPAKPTHGFWTKALDYVDGSQRLQFVVEDQQPGPAGPDGQPGAAVPNQWFWAPQKACSADGDPRASISPTNCLMPEIPVGALIAKIGGSTAGKADGVKTFAVGSFCVIDLDASTKGTLYFTMNTDPLSSVERSGQLLVKLLHAR